MSNLTRRQFIERLAGTCAGLYGGHALAAVKTDNRVLFEALASFLRNSLIVPAMQCGAHFGTDAPAATEVEAFRDRLLHLQWRGAQVIHEFLQASLAEDFAGGQILTIDGWVMARSEALAAAVYQDLLGDECQATG